jgi:hypothetical protein
MRRIWCAVLMAAAMVTAAGAAHADDKVECSKLDLEFPPADKADWTECYSFHLTEPPSGEGAEGASADVEIMLADIGTHVVHLTSVVAGKDTYYEKVPVSRKMSAFEELEKIEDMESEPGFERYQIVRFRALLWKESTDCIGFVKYAGAMISSGGSTHGARGYLAGYDCWRNGVPDRAQIEATLDAIDD